jgi:hypothetical protein
LEAEVLALLRMGAETAEGLAGMFVPADEEGLRRRGGSTQAGIDMVLNRLAAEQLVTDRTVTGQRWWELTDLGVRAIREGIDAGPTTPME